jgi:hypothetical protein
MAKLVIVISEDDMKTKFKIRCKKVGIDGDWWEEEERELENETPQEWAERIIENFNATLHPHETARELLEVVILEENIQPIEKPTSKDVIVDVSYSWDCPECPTVNHRQGLPPDSFSEYCDNCSLKVIIKVDESNNW